MDFPAQISQPVPFFYGPTSPGTVTQDLQSGFDYVVTTIWLTNDSEGGPYLLLLSDESGVNILAASAGVNPEGEVSTFTWSGEMPIGPRTALQIETFNVSGVLYIGGYALTPPSVLHI